MFLFTKITGGIMFVSDRREGGYAFALYLTLRIDKF